MPLNIKNIHEDKIRCEVKIIPTRWQWRSSMQSSNHLTVVLLTCSPTSNNWIWRQSEFLRRGQRRKDIGSPETHQALVWCYKPIFCLYYKNMKTILSATMGVKGKRKGHCFLYLANVLSHAVGQDKRYNGVPSNSPFPPLNIQIPASLPSYILFRRRMGLLSVLIHTPAMALSNISFCSSSPSPPLYTSTPPFWPPHILLRRIMGLLPVLESGFEWIQVEWKLGTKWFSCSPKKWGLVHTGWMRIRH